MIIIIMFSPPQCSDVCHVQVVLGEVQKGVHKYHAECCRRSLIGCDGVGVVEGGDGDHVGAVQHGGVVPTPEGLAQDRDRLPFLQVEEGIVAGVTLDGSGGGCLEATPRVPRVIVDPLLYVHREGAVGLGDPSWRVGGREFPDGSLAQCVRLG